MIRILLIPIQMMVAVVSISEVTRTMMMVVAVIPTFSILTSEVIRAMRKPKLVMIRTIKRKIAARIVPIALMIRTRVLLAYRKNTKYLMVALPARATAKRVKVTPSTSKLRLVYKHTP